MNMQFISPIDKPQVPSGAFRYREHSVYTPGGTYASLEISKAEVAVKTPVIIYHQLADPFLETPLNAMLIATKDLFPAEMGIGWVLHRVRHQLAPWLQ